MSLPETEVFPFYKKDDPGGFLSNTSRCEPFTFIVPQFIMEIASAAQVIFLSVI